MARRFREVPDISDDYREFQSENIAFFGEKLDGAEKKEIDSIFFIDGIASPENVRDHNEIAIRIEEFRASINARTAQMQANPIWQHRGGSSRRAFDRYKRTLRKTAQEVFTHPTERTTGENGPIIMDPRLISDTVLENLGLSELIPEKGTIREEKMRQRAEMIPAIYKALKNLETIIRPDERRGFTGYYRLMRIRDGENRGFLLGTRNVGSKKEGVRKVFFKTDLRTEERVLSNIESNHFDEIRKLKAIELTLLEMIGRADKIKKGQILDMPDEEILEFKNALISIVDSLELVRAEHKVELRENIEELKIRDGIVAVGKRLKEIENIWRHLAKDRMKIQQLISEQKAPMNKFRTLVEGLNDKLKLLSVDAIEGEEKESIIRNLRTMANYAKGLKFEPHLSIGEKFQEQSRRVIHALDVGDTEEAKREFIKMYLISKIERTYDQLMDVQKRLSADPENISPELITKELEQIYIGISEHMVAPKTEVRDYYDAYVEIYEFLRGNMKKLETLISPEREEKPAEEEDNKYRTFDKIRDEIAKRTPRLAGYMNKVTGLVEKFMRGKEKKFGFKQEIKAEVKKDKEVSKPNYTMSEKLKTLKAIHDEIQDFDFARLVKELP